MKTKEKFVGFETLKRSVSMAQVLERYQLLTTFHRSGDNLSGPCPLHGGHNRTQFRVSLSRNCFICFGDCHGGGSIIDFVSRKEGVGIRDAALLLQDWFRVTDDGNGQGVRRMAASSQPVSPDHNGYNPPLRFALRNLDESHPYLKERGLMEETIRTFGLGYCRAGTLSGWIAIPIHNREGQLVAFAARWPGTPPEGIPKYKLPRGFRKSLELFNLHRAAAADPRLPLVVVEGFFGCIRLWQAGHRRVVSIMGSMLSDQQEELIVQAAGSSAKVILMFDEDEAGREGRAKAEQRLATKVNVRSVVFAAPGMQPDQLTPEQLRHLLQ